MLRHTYISSLVRPKLVPHREHCLNYKVLLGLRSLPHTEHKTQAVLVTMTITVIAHARTHMFIMVCCFSPTLTKFEFGRHILGSNPQYEIRRKSIQLELNSFMRTDRDETDSRFSHLL
jgi:hypothetical protein